MQLTSRRPFRGAHFRLSTRPLDPALADLPDDPALLERRRRQVVAGGYRLSRHPADRDQVTLVVDAALTLAGL